MSDSSKNQKLVQVTSVDVLLDDGMRITWQGYRPAVSGDNKTTTYFTTIPGDGIGSTTVDLVSIGAQALAGFAIELTLEAGVATLDGTPLEIGHAVLVPAQGEGDPAELVFSSETCTLKVCPQPTTSPIGDPGVNPPPPPYPGGSNR